MESNQYFQQKHFIYTIFLVLNLIIKKYFFNSAKYDKQLKIEQKLK